MNEDRRDVKYATKKSGHLTAGISRRTILKGVGATGVASLMFGLGTRAPANAAVALNRITPSKGGTLRVGIASLSTADALDPAYASTPGGYAIATVVYDTLTRYDTTGSVVPYLAESIVPGATADIWTVKLRNAVWQDGGPVTSDDLLYSIQRILAPKNPLPPASLISFVDLDNITRIDERTLRFTLKYPTVLFSESFAQPTLGIVPKGFNAKSPIGSGPYRLTANRPGVRLGFEANKHYWGEGPYADALQIISFADGSSQIDGLIGKQIDVASEFDPSLAPVVKAHGNGLKVYTYTTSGTLTWQMNVNKKPFDNVKVRQALRLAVDRKQLISQVYGDYAKLGNDIFGPFDPLYDSSLPQRVANASAAKRLIQEAGYKLPLSVELTAAPIQQTANLQNDVLVEQAAKAGFDITFNQVDEATYYGSAYGTYPLSLSYWDSRASLCKLHTRSWMVRRTTPPIGTTLSTTRCTSKRSRPSTKVRGVHLSTQCRRLSTIEARMSCRCS
jgi:peptide/nickel transport system substrate-binding protein